MSVQVLNLSKYSQPEIIEDSRESWVEYGADNNYYSYLIDRYRNSATNNAVINNIVRLTYGRGLDAKDASRHPEWYAQMKMLFSKQALRSVAMDLKLLGQGSFQVIIEKGVVRRVEHMPTHLLRPEKCDEKGNINGYYYSDNWEDTKKFPPTYIEKFDASNTKDGLYVLVFGNYSVGMKYFCSPDYEGALDYCVLEEEISAYLINETKNSFSPTTVINFNNGIPTEEQRRKISNDVINKATGSTGKKVIVAFNDDETKKVTVDSIPLNDAPQHYEYLSRESRDKILAGHNVTSSMLVGITTESQGFNSNADEIEVAAKYFYNTVIRVYQEQIIDAVDSILSVNGVTLNLFFRRLNLLEDLEADQQKAEETTLSSQVCCSATHSSDDEVASKLIEVGDDVPENWMLLAEAEVDYTDEEEPSLLAKIWNFVSTGTAVPNARSEQDKTVDGIKFITRYKYDGDVSDNSREFCKKMVQASKVYRKEDIIRMGTIPVNAGWGAEGADTYSIWLYKGGGMCRHKWVKQIYAAFEGGGIDVNNPNARQVAETKAEKYGYIVKNPNKVNQRPVDMPHFGFLPTNKIWGR